MAEHIVCPTRESVERLHRQLAPSEQAYAVIHLHCVAIAELSRLLAQHRNALYQADCSGVDVHSMPLTQGMLTAGTVPERPIDPELAYVGGLIHDIGTYRLLLRDGSDGEPIVFDGPHYIQHGVIGYELALQAGFDESIAQFCRNHTGVGLSRSEVVRQHLPLPAADYVPLTLEQECVMVADKYNSKSVPPRFLTAQAYERKARRFGEQNAQRWLDLVRQYGQPDIDLLAQELQMSVER